RHTMKRRTEWFIVIVLAGLPFSCLAFFTSAAVRAADELVKEAGVHDPRVKHLPEDWTLPIRTATRDQVEASLLAEDWPRVSDLIAEFTSQMPAVQRLILGHACLALNRNNESVTLFLESDAPADRQAWERWTATFAQTH